MLRFIRPTMPPPERWLPFLDAAYDARYFSNFGPVVTRFEQELTAAYGDGRVAVTVANATLGLTAALLALGVRGRVVMPSFTFPATAYAAKLAGCTPLFCDVDLRTWELDPQALAALLDQPDVGAVIHVRAFGFCQCLDAVEELVRAAGLPLIVDAAAAIGGQLANGRFAGSAGDVEIFSLHATKVFGIGEGGVALAPPELATRIRAATNFGLVEGTFSGMGFNAKMSELHAAVGLAVLREMPAFVARRAEVAADYRAALAQAPNVHLPEQPGLPPWQTFPILLSPALCAADFVRCLGEQGVMARRYYHPALHWMPDFDASNDLPVTDALAQRTVCLPIYSDMTDLEAAWVIEATQRALTFAATPPVDTIR